jgi:hypothetical protein
MTNDKYKLFRQYMMNELGITKDDIQEWTREVVLEVAEKYVADQLSHTPLDNRIQYLIREKFNQQTISKDIATAIGKIIAEDIKISLKERE